VIEKYIRVKQENAECICNNFTAKNIRRQASLYENLFTRFIEK